MNREVGGYMKFKKLSTILAIFFFAGIAVLTFSARAIHDASLPQVVAKRLDTKSFPCEYVDASAEVRRGTSDQLALDKSVYDSGDVYVAVYYDKNGDERCFAKKIFIDIGGEKDGFYAVLSGIFPADRVIISASKEIFDGAEIVINDAHISP